MYASTYEWIKMNIKLFQLELGADRRTDGQRGVMHNGTLQPSREKFLHTM